MGLSRHSGAMRSIEPGDCLSRQAIEVCSRYCFYQRDAAGELTDFGEKLTPPLIDDRRDMAEAIALGNRGVTGQHDEHARSGLAGLEQSFTMLIVSNRRMRAISCGVNVGNVCS